MAQYIKPFDYKNFPDLYFCVRAGIKLINARDDDRPPILHSRSKGSVARGSNEQPGQQAGDKRKHIGLKDPMSPESIRKAARKCIAEYPNLFEWHATAAFPKYILHLYGRDILEGLRFRPEHYAPILQVKYDGNFKYVRVMEYKLKVVEKDEVAYREAYGGL